MMKPIIGVVTPYSELAYIVQATAPQDDAVILQRDGDLDEGVKAAKELVERGADVIISRGGTALRIREALSVPVVEIGVSGYDVLKAVMKAKEFSPRVALVGFPNVLYDAEIIGPALGIECIKLVIQSEDDLENRLIEAKMQGAGVVVGDVVTSQRTAILGLSSILIESGRHAVASAFQQAIEVARARWLERKRASLLHSVVSQSREGIVIVDRNGKVELVNPVAKRLLGARITRPASEQSEQIVKLLGINKSLEGDRTEDQLITLGDHHVLLSREPLYLKDEVAGSVAVLSDVTRLKSLEQQVQRQLRQRGHKPKYRFESIRGRSQAIRRVIEQAKRYAQSDATVLIEGETGTGKELFAHALHAASRRRDGPFLAINCAALPDNLLESELFGYEEGAFTGARRGGKPGMFELAHRGTIFLDEIGDIPPHVQTRLLRVLENQEVMRVGGERVIHLDVRAIAATHADLWEKVKAGTFRSDLYYRLNVLKLRVPSLRERPDDIPLLAEFFVSKYCKAYGLPPKRLARDAKRLLKEYDWPGNVRQLENVCERLCCMVDSPEIALEDVSNVLLEERSLQRVTGPKAPAAPGTTGSLRELSDSVFWRVAAEENFRPTRIARRLGISRTTVWRRLREKSENLDLNGEVPVQEM